MDSVSGEKTHSATLLMPSPFVQPKYHFSLSEFKWKLLPEHSLHLHFVVAVVV